MPQPPTLALLREHARRHLLRFEPSEAQMRRVLARRVASSPEPGDGPRLVEQVIDELRASGALDDRRVAAAWVDTLRRRGLSRAAIRARLRDKGIAGPVVDASLADLDDDLDAARTYARRRRLGPYRTADRAERRDRDIAALARAGFPFGVCRRVMDELP